METPSLFVQNINHYLSLLTIVGGIVLAMFAVILSYYSFEGKENKFLSTVSRYVLPLGFLVTLGGAFLTLFYEYGLKYVPCDLCWYQRVFLYPQVFLFAYAWYKKDKAVLPYALILSILGLIVAIYHHALQMGYDLMKPCSTAFFAVDCSTPSFIEFGFVTFPFMAVVLFAFICITIVTALYSAKKGGQ